jgi:phage shock protein PspC (stress-responsive transcriptional regulator)
MKKQIFISDKNKKIGGVCGGIGEYLNIDSTVIRLTVIILFIIFKLPVAGIYILLWAVLPQQEN